MGESLRRSAQYPGDLPLDKRREYEQMKDAMGKFLTERKYSLVRRYAKKKVLSRLMEKLDNHSLNHSSVPGIASGVWDQLHHASGGDVLKPMSAIEEIVRDIIHEYENSMPAAAKMIVDCFISEYRQVDEMVVRILVREMWPEIKKSFSL